MKGTTTTTTTTVNGYLRLRRVAGCMNSNNKKLIGCSFIGAFIYAFIRYSLRFVSFRVVSAVFAIYMANNIRKCLLIDSPVFSSTCDRANTHTHTYTHRGHRLQLQLHLQFQQFPCSFSLSACAHLHLRRNCGQGNGL